MNRPIYSTIYRIPIGRVHLTLKIRQLFEFKNSRGSKTNSKGLKMKEKNHYNSPFSVLH